MIRNRKGFTLIELLIVVVIIGILAAIAIPKFSSVKQKGYRTQAISDLMSLRTAEETFFADSNKYADLSNAALTAKFSSTSGVGAPVIVPSTSFWSATLSHPQLPGVTCAIANGTPNPIVAGAGEGEPVCK
jgi:type IV pilus assembly protein PilA